MEQCSPDRAVGDDAKRTTQRRNGSPHARLALLERYDDRWTAELVAVEYDWERAVEAATAHGRPEWAGVLHTGRL